MHPIQRAGAPCPTEDLHEQEPSRTAQSGSLLQHPLVPWESLASLSHQMPGVQTRTLFLPSLLCHWWAASTHQPPIFRLHRKLLGTLRGLLHHLFFFTIVSFSPETGETNPRVSAAQEACSQGVRRYTSTSHRHPGALKNDFQLACLLWMGCGGGYRFSKSFRKPTELSLIILKYWSPSHLMSLTLRL